MNKMHQDNDMQLWLKNIHNRIIQQLSNTVKGIALSLGFCKKPPGAIV
ncbi:hypothetical protein Desaf_0195 [Desulfocurvibacter africanus subsp. africanus str. Walvis Bay]|uniref:Uncharacterized protein n=1 Tax=Desulfocurvibacter africanus subsp. africanus str. Walvis Bay TaxID=690850 RepID=F3YVG3_DESAF|nr:hypothetical protein Desaf_0195 [Desulfocurvibacter africanus subsp. africanus str. Walvis Bay]